VIVVDNGSEDETIKFIREQYPQITVLENKKNLGFAKANNQGLKLSKGEYVLICNPDIILEPDFLKQATETIKKDKKIAAAGGKLLKVKWSNEDLPNPEKTDIIDSLGLIPQKSHNFKEINSDKKDKPEETEQKQVFGISGALTLFRRSCLEQIKYQEEFFDENFFAYKEDIDIAWRLKLAGFTAVINPKATAYHFRGISGSDERKTRGKKINQLSHKNHLLLIIKNQTLTNLFIFQPHILLREFGKFLYLLIREQSTLLALGQFVKQLPSTLKKRKYILSKRKISNKEIRQWFK